MPETLAATAAAPASARAGERTLRRAGILGIGTALPPRAVPTAEIAARLGLEEDWLVSRTGIRSRRIAAPDARVADLATEAGAAALASAGVAATDLDLVIVATLASDEITPSTFSCVAHALGTTCGGFDVGAACNAFLAALSAGATFVEAGRAERVLVVGAEKLSRFTDRDDRRTAGLFADGAGAVVLGAQDGGGVGPVVLKTDGGGHEGIIAHRDHGFIEMDGHETFKHAVNRLAEVTREVVAEAGLTLDDIDVFAYHQANQRITKSLALRLELDPAKVVDCIAEQGNTSAATLPLALAAAEADGLLRDGSRVLLAAFGAGFTWGGALVEWSRS